MLSELAVGIAARERSRSTDLYLRGRSVFPGGVTRATIELDPQPIYMASGKGAYVQDVDGNRFLDLNNNFTTLIHGHGYPPVADAVSRLLHNGSCFSNPTHYEIALAELLVDRIPTVEQLRFVNTGTEAVMFAIKAARAYTGRPAIIRFAGCYHGSYDWAETGQNGVMVHNGVDGTTGLPGYAGAPAQSADDVIVLEFNDIEALERAVKRHADHLAAILIDPMPSRAGLLQPLPQFVARVNALAKRHGILLIADEVLNLRQGYCGASHRYGFQPDLITLGKIIGGGFPIGAIGGRADVMAVFGGDAPNPLVPQGGTFSANPVSMIAGLVAMETLTPEAFGRLELMGETLCGELRECAARLGRPFSVAGAASLFRIHPKSLLPRTYTEARMTAGQTQCMRALTRFFREQGILLPFGAAACLSTAMTERDIDQVASVFQQFLQSQHQPSWEE
ncbi:aspartate aminotransferase family protein [Rhizobium glycinendophyticum]|uniref:Aspartate aminotransferase family protein n=1 Tax=Rhizobium glycinendophyticum TaxID=2589807 RepID=A0A504TSV1_9HYPH|nr:aspartate aminotransferase family protein [Rhizobium glycinendophyticum]TPP04587.1 aspartate aminotransferase family protein [Rhizobium glycinendophyticum]